ncbi:MAG: D-alanine--D-alanine ligase [Candidatus Liptonbacteria bacterium]|nr:D-alanine--D-alanine ligase [Candidatus Liptonbacteria bacterium]
MKKIKVALICGGFSSEREVSLKSGAQIARSLTSEKYEVSLIEIAKDGRWLLSSDSKEINSGEKTLSILPGNTAIAQSDLRGVDVAFLALHGYFGEDGKIQSILELLGIPYTGSGVMASATAMNKAKTNELAALADLKVPPFIVAHNSKIKPDFGYPVVVKPNESGSSVGVTIVEKESDLEKALEKALSEGGEAIVQKYIAGRELTCGVMGNSGRTEILALPPIEIVSPNKFFDYEAKYTSQETQEICPAPVDESITRAVQEVAKKVHVLLGCDGLTRSDFILDKESNLHFLEINTIPGMTEASLAPKEAKALGWSFPDFLDKIITLALERHKK